MYKDKYAKDVIRIYNMKQNNIPDELLRISQAWYDYAKRVPDVGSCVLGAGFLFQYNNKWYFLMPCSPYQSSLSWERNKDDIEEMLKKLNVKNLVYEWGNMD